MMIRLCLLLTFVYMTICDVALADSMQQSFDIREKYKNKTQLSSPAAEAKFLQVKGDTSHLQRLDDNGLIKSGNNKMGSSSEGKQLQDTEVKKSQAMNRYKIDKNNQMLKKSLEVEKNPNAHTKANQGGVVETLSTIKERKSCIEGADFNISLGRNLVLDCEEVESWLDWQDRETKCPALGIRSWDHEIFSAGKIERRNILAKAIGKNQEQIHEYIDFCGSGGLNDTRCRRGGVGDGYSLKYKIREKHIVFVERGEYWQINTELQENLVNTNECHEISRTCTKSGVKTFFDKYERTRPCWEEQISYQCYSQPQGGCAHLEAQGCVLENSSCDHRVGDLCLRWKRNYVCTSTRKDVSHKSASNKVFCLGGDCHQPQMERDSDIANVAYLAALKSAKDDCQKAKDGVCVQPITLFPGNIAGCEKVIASMLNCCSSFKGWGNDLQLCRCSNEEKNLAAKRSKGLCHNVGTYCSSKDPIFSSCLKKKTNYCCFESKLSRIFQEQGRAQLGIGWGSSERPDCRPLTMDEFTRIDFAKLNLEELFGDMLARAKNKGQSIQNGKSSNLPSLKENTTPQKQQTIGKSHGEGL